MTSEIIRGGTRNFLVFRPHVLQKFSNISDFRMLVELRMCSA